MTGAQNKLIHELVEQSRDRVAHVRAGQSLVHVLDTQSPPAAPAELLQRGDPHANQRRLQQQATGVTASDASGLRTTMRKRAAIALPPTSHHQLSGRSSTAVPTSYEQFAFYAGSKLRQSESLNMLDRRKALPTSSSTKQLAKLVALKTKGQTTAGADTAATKLMRAVNVLKTQHAFSKNAKSKMRSLALPHDLVPGVVKNAHVAFQEFRAAEDRRTRAPAAADAATMNAATHEPVRFGDTVALLSLVSDLPMAVARNGRTLTVADAITGPHMAFTIVDFHNPSRRDDLVFGEDFWLRVDTSALEEVIQEEDEIMALLVDTHYYLGGPGWLEDDEADDGHHLPAISASRHHCQASTKSHQRLFKIVAMKATVPSSGYYGDDSATREYACETNPSIMRLAKWRFVNATRHGGGIHTMTPLVLNGATVAMKQAEFSLNYDATRRRAVLLGSMEPLEETESTVGRQRETCAWQLRLLRRGEPVREHCSSHSPRASAASHKRNQQPTEKQSLEWLQRHENQVASQEKHIQDKQRLARDARRAYEKVAALSNAKLAQIEKHKALHHREYFKSRADAVASLPRL